ncbi:hypothetical protein [Sorangium sp. So ce131]|uniref:hypothetical protein n=1 Tax=Sorangium sp. So ce131 TaxID=3133282 RepID=UPI003F614347
MTYFLERDDGGWVAFALRLLGRADDGSWMVGADFKNPAGEIAVWFRQERDALLSRASGPLDGPMGRLSPRRGELLWLAANHRGFIFDLHNAGIDGLACDAVYSADAGDRLAHVTAFGCISKTNPRRGTTLTEMEGVFRAILESFCFL